MIQTSQAWKDYSAEHGVFHIKAELDNGTKLYLSDEDFMSGSVSITDSVSGMGAFNVGGVITNSFNATLNNFGGKFNSYNLAGATIDVKFGIVYSEDYLNNLFDKTTSTPNKIMSNTGVVSNQTGWFVSDYIPVTDGETYKTNFHTLSVPFYVCCFDSSKNFLGSVNRDGQYITASVEGETVAYVVGCGQMGSINDVYFYEYASAEEWIDRGVYTLEKPTSLGSTIKVTGYDNMDRLNKKYDGTYDTLTNLFDPSDITQNKLLNTNGTLTDTTNTFVTGYIPAQPNTLYKISNILYGYVVCYDADKVRLGASAVVQTGRVTTLPYTAYIRGTGLSALLPQTSVKGEPNLLDTSTVWSNVYISRDGTISNLNERYVTDYIEVDDCVTYSANLSAGYVCCYDSSKNYIGYVDASSWSGTRWQFTTYIEGETVAYIRTYGYEPTISDDYVREYFGEFIFPYSASQMVENLCKTYGVGFDANSWGLDSFNVNEFEYNENTSCRQVLSWIMEIGGGYARINPQGVIECKPFKDPSDGEDFTLDKLKSLNVFIEDITITGVKAFYTVDNEELSVLDGTEGYVIGINNPMINEDNASAIATRVGGLLNGLSFRPFDASAFGDPSYEAGDVVSLEDYLGETHLSFITSLTYSVNQAERLECNAETTVDNNNNYSSNSSTIIQEASNYIKGEIKDYVIGEGTSGDWSYRIWSSGIKECWYRGTDNVEVTNAWGSGYYSSINSVADYPVTFSSPPTVMYGVNVPGGSGWGTYVDDDTISNPGSFYIISFASGSYSIEVNIYAKGV